MKNTKLKQKNESGITLIALVITIIVLLILAGVTINLTLGDNGIFKVAEQAARNYKDAEEKELGLLEQFEAGITAGKVAKIENGIQYVGDGMGNVIPVPEGFSYLTGTENTGFVIKNNTDGNEFVWIPVENMGYSYNRYAFLTTQPADGFDEETQSVKIKNGLESEYFYTEKIIDEENISVNKYGGYYIGRYESGIKNGELVIQKNEEVWNKITIDNAEAVAEELYNKDENNVISRLCSSYAWDTALKFIELENKIYPYNSINGNYKTGTEQNAELQKTGYEKKGHCNIYDMGGNVYEWTSEYSNLHGATLRSGSYIDEASNVPAGRRISTNKQYTDTFIGFRVALFM